MTRFCFGRGSKHGHGAAPTFPIVRKFLIVASLCDRRQVFRWECSDMGTLGYAERVNDRPISRNSLSKELVLETQAKFEKFSGRSLSEHNAREALGNLADLVKILIEWNQSPEA